MELKDLFLGPIYLALIYFVAIRIKNQYAPSATYTKYFLPGLSLKLFGAIMAGFIYQFYYGGGDTFWFFQGGRIIGNAFWENPIAALKILGLDALEYTYDTYEYTSRIWWFRDSKSMFVIKIVGVLCWFCFNSYVVVACFFACISFACSWMFYLILIDLYPRLEKPFAYAIFFIPSVFFWGSGIFKDTLTLSGTMLFASSFYYVFIKKKHIIKYICLLFIAGVIIMHIRSFYLLILIPCCLIWFFISIKDKIKNPASRILLTPFLFLFTFLSVTLGIQQLSTFNSELSNDGLNQKLQGFHSWHGYLGEQGGSGYTLGHIDYSPIGIIKKVPIAINVAIFRPYLWEAKNPVMLLAALESFIFLIISLYVLLKTKVIGLFTLIFSNAEISFCFIFGLLFAFVAGFTSFNFGALVRYKIPFMPFYSIALILMIFRQKAHKN